MTRATFSIEPVRSASDIEVIAKLFRAYADSLQIDLCFQDFENELAGLPGKYAPPAGELLLARLEDGAPVGCVAFRPLPEEGACEMKRLYVSPEARGMRMGQALVEAIIAAAVQAGNREMKLDTLAQMTEAIALYKKMGFEEIGPYFDVSNSPIEEDNLFFARRL